MTREQKQSQVWQLAKFAIGFLIPVAGSVAVLRWFFGLEPTKQFVLGWGDVGVVLALFLFILVALPYLPGVAHR